MSKFIAGLITGILIASAFFLLQHRWLHTFDNNVAPIEATETEYTETEENRLPKDFLVFYDRFHSDSVYQLSHILFPLEGLPPDTDSLTASSGTFRWQKDSVAFWDNRCVQHLAIWDYFPQTRSGFRVTIKGDRPI